MAVPAMIHLDCSLFLQGMRSLASNLLRSRPSYTGNTTLPASGCGSSRCLGMNAIMHVGRGTTVGVSARASLRVPPAVKRAPCRERPDKAHGRVPIDRDAASPHTHTNRRSSIATGGSEVREVCWRSALRKTWGLNMFARKTGFESAAPLRTLASQSSIASFFLIAACSHMAGESGPSHLASHGSGTLPAARDVVIVLTSAVSKSAPLRTRSAELMAAATILTSLSAASDSIATNASTGAAFSTTIPWLTALRAE
mmetsp:Transcript_63303/g.92766  ORF Transcript_63303/g.92766 Transcript_63303/m.92766 type:complete len:255 (+) Transcript_63303:175-939(+)